jgi:hypothetical protein
MSFKEKISNTFQKAKHAYEHQRDTYRENVKATQLRETEHYIRETNKMKYKAASARYRAQIAASERAAYRAGPVSDSGISVNQNFGAGLMGGLGSGKRPDYSGTNQFGSWLMSAPKKRTSSPRKRPKRRKR